MHMSTKEQNQMDESKLDRIQLGEKLKEAREYLDLSQDEVAKKIGIARAAISLIETGQRKVDALELKEFARIYQRPISYFTDDEVVAEAAANRFDYLPRAFQELSEKDREELTRFAEFLKIRNKAGDK